MSYQYRYCPTCGTRRAAFGYRCAVCGGLVRHAERPASPAPAEAPGRRRPFAFGSEWRAYTTADARQALREQALGSR